MRHKKCARKNVTPREKRRLKLITSAAELFLTKGTAGVSMQDVAAAANVSRATLYTYFGSKDEIFDAAVDGITLSVRDRAKMRSETYQKMLRYKKSCLWCLRLNKRRGLKCLSSSGQSSISKFGGVRNQWREKGEK